MDAIGQFPSFMGLMDEFARHVKLINLISSEPARFSCEYKECDTGCSRASGSGLARACRAGGVVEPVISSGRLATME